MSCSRCRRRRAPPPPPRDEFTICDDLSTGRRDVTSHDGRVVCWRFVAPCARAVAAAGTLHARHVSPSRGSTLGPGGGHRPLQIVATPPNLSVLLTRCGQLILRKISKFDDTRCQILRLKCTKVDFRWGSTADPAEAAYSAPLPQTLCSCI